MLRSLRLAALAGALLCAAAAAIGAVPATAAGSGLAFAPGVAVATLPPTRPVTIAQAVETYADAKVLPAAAAGQVAAPAVAPADPVKIVVEAAPAAASTTVVAFTWGAWLQHDVFPFLWVMFTAAFAYAVRFLPGWALLLLKSYGEQRLLAQIHDIAANMVAGVSKNGTRTYQADVGNQMLATAVRVGLEGFPMFVKLLGGEDALRMKLLGMLNLDPAAAIDPVAAPAASTPVAAS